MFYNTKKIAVIGCAGSGKTWLALQISKQLEIPVYHLDEYYWLPSWKRVTEDEFIKVHHELCIKDKWIIEGIYSRYMPERFKSADLIIFLDISRYQCLWNVIKRAIQFHNKLIPGVPVGCEQNIFSFKFIEFLQWVWNFPYRSRPKIDELLHQYADKKQIVVLRSHKEVNAFIEIL